MYMVSVTKPSNPTASHKGLMLVFSQKNLWRFMAHNNLLYNFFSICWFAFPKHRHIDYLSVQRKPHFMSWLHSQCERRCSESKRKGVLLTGANNSKRSRQQSGGFWGHFFPPHSFTPCFSFLVGHITSPLKGKAWTYKWGEHACTAL